MKAIQSAAFPKAYLRMDEPAWLRRSRMGVELSTASRG
jgi:hypothetical protein